MHAEVLIVQVCKFLDDGDGMYRLHEPCRFLAGLPGVVAIDCHYAHRHLPRLLRLADVVILQFLHNWDLLSMLDERRAAGKVTVFEANDNFFDVQPWNPVADSWRQQSIRAEYRIFMSQCDAVQTSTPWLANLWKPWARRVQTFANQLTVVPPLSAPPVRPLTIGWGGSVGHFADLYAIAPSLQRWLNNHPNVHLALMTHELAKSFFDLAPERFHFTNFSSLSDYLRFLKSLDIGLAPLLPTDYNRGRSDVKFLEYAVSGVPGIYADLDPYRDSVVEGQTGFLYSTPRQMLERLEQLVADAELRQRIRSQAHQYVSEERRLEKHIATRLEFYRRLLPASPVGFELPAEILAATEVSGRYLQLRPQATEEVFLAAQESPPLSQTLDQLEQIGRRFPDYHAAHVTRGRMLNDAKRSAEAFEVLQRALKLEPDSAATLCELGRCFYFRNEIASARECFEKALRINPWYYPGWQYFLRFLRFVRAADSTDWAQRADQTFPDDFPLALLTIALHPPQLQIGLLSELLERSWARPHAEDSDSLLAFEQSAAEAIHGVEGGPEGAALLRRACELFPHSARLADMLGQVLYRQGDAEESATCFRRALVIRRTAKMYAAEFPRDDRSFHFWQFADSVARWG